MDLYDNARITRRWGCVVPSDCSAAYRGAYRETMMRIRAFIARYETPSTLGFFDRHAVLNVSDSDVLLYLEHLFACENVLAEPNPLPAVCARHPVLRYMVANLRCETPLTHDVIAVLQNIIDNAEPNAFFPQNFAVPALDSLYAGRQEDIAGVAAAAGFSSQLADMVRDIRSEAVPELPDQFFHALNDMMACSSGVSARYICAALKN
jgi:hypothetical protein